MLNLTWAAFLVHAACNFSSDPAMLAVTFGKHNMTDAAQASRRCPKCEGAMVTGYIADRNAGWYEPTKWFPGELDLDWAKGVKKSSVPPLLVVTDRCTRCGYLESFARQPTTEAEPAAPPDRGGD